MKWSRRITYVAYQTVEVTTVCKDYGGKYESSENNQYDKHYGNNRQAARPLPHKDPLS
jgi:hypothetical protein